MCHKMGLPLLVLVILLTIGSGESRSSEILPEPPQDGAAGLRLQNGPDDCGEDSHSSCVSWVKSGECEKDPEVKQSCSFSCSLSGQLWVAAWTGNKSTVEITIAAGANPLCTKPAYDDVYGLFNSTAIHMAARAGHPSIIETLLNAGVDVNLQTTGGRTPIREAAQEGNIDALDILIENNANVNIPDSAGLTPLMGAPWLGHYNAYNITRALLKANASLDVTGGNRNATALHYAVRGGNQDVVVLLIEHNANVDIPNSDGWTPLMQAAVNGELNITRALIQANASLDVIGGYLNVTALHYAVWNSNQDVAVLLIENNANVNIHSTTGSTPLMSAARHGEFNITRALIKANASLDVTGGYSNATALIYAILGRNKDVALLLIEHNANVNIPNSAGWTPLMEAGSNGQLNIIRALIKANASLDVTGGWPGLDATALHYAAKMNNQDVVVLLMDNGADSSITNNLGYTPADLARSEGHNQLTDLIESYPTTHRLILSR